MSKDIYVGLIDSGCSFETFDKVAIKQLNKEIIYTKQEQVVLKHGDVIGSILAQNNKINIYDVQVFEQNHSVSAHYLYKALEYLSDKKVDVISMSLGLLSNYQELENICSYFVQKGTTLISSFPRSGHEFVFPASYNEVIAVTSDGRCKDFEIRVLNEKSSLFGANPSSSESEVAGASVAVAKFTKVFCDYLTKGFSKEEALNSIKKGYKI